MTFIPQNQFFDRVFKHITGEIVEQYKVALTFIGTEGRKRKVERRSIVIGTFPAHELQGLTMDELYTKFQALCIKEIPARKIQPIADSMVSLRFNGQSIEVDSGITIVKSDSNLMIYAPKMIFNPWSNRIEGDN